MEPTGTITPNPNDGARRMERAVDQTSMPAAHSVYRLTAGGRAVEEAGREEQEEPGQDGGQVFQGGTTQ